MSESEAERGASDGWGRSVGDRYRRGGGGWGGLRGEADGDRGGRGGSSGAANCKKQ
jgi:hypothetical protein